MRRGRTWWTMHGGLLAIAVALILVACGGAGPTGPTPDPEPDPGLRELLDEADGDGRLDVAITFTVVAGLEADALATSSNAPTRPVMLEVDAMTPGGQPFRAILVGAREEALATGFEGVMRLRGRTAMVDGRRILVGFAQVDEPPGDGPRRMGGFSFLAARAGDVPGGPPAGGVYNLDGDAALAGFCADDHVTGAALLRNRGESLRVVNALLLRLHEELPCPPGTLVSGDARMHLEGEAVTTRLGTVLVGYGAVQVRRGDAVATLPAFAVGLPERLSDTFRQERFGGEAAAGVYVLDPFAAALFERVRDGTMFFREMPEGLLGIDEGDLLVARPFPRLPEGLLRRVTGVRVGARGVAIDTEPAEMSDLLRTGGFTFDRELGLDDVVEVVALTDGVDLSEFERAFAASAAATHGEVAPLSGLIPTIHVNKQVVPGIRFEGSLDLNVRPTVSFRCRGALCSAPEIQALFTIEQSAELALLGDGAFGSPRRFELVEIRLATIVVAIPPVPVTITPVVVVALTVSGTGEVAFETRVTQSVSFTGGVEKPSGAPWRWVRELERDVAFVPPSFDGSFSATARLSVGAEVRVYGGVLEAGADVGGFVRLTGRIPGNPTWELEGGLDAYAYFGIDLLVISWSDDLQLFERTWPIATAPNARPTISQPEILTPFTPLLADLTPSSVPRVLVGDDAEITVAVADFEDADGCCRVDWFLTPPGGGIQRFETAGPAPVLSFVPAALGRYTLQARVYDSQLANAERTLVFDAVDPFELEQLLSISLERTSVGTPAPGDAVTFQAQLFDPFDVDCCTVAWRVTRLGEVSNGTFVPDPIENPIPGFGGPSVVAEFETTAPEFHQHARTFTLPGSYLVEVVPVTAITERLGGPRFDSLIARRVRFDVVREPENPPEVVRLEVAVGGPPVIAGREILINYLVNWYQPGPNRSVVLRTQDDGANITIRSGTGGDADQLLTPYTYMTPGTKSLRLIATGDDGLVTIFDTSILVSAPGSGGDPFGAPPRSGSPVTFP